MDALQLNGTCRASFSVYNTEQEVHAFLNALEGLHTSRFHMTTKTVPSESVRLTKEQVDARLRPMKVWQDLYRQLMLLGKALPSLSEALKTSNGDIVGL